MKKSTYEIQLKLNFKHTCNLQSPPKKISLQMPPAWQTVGQPLIRYEAVLPKRFNLNAIKLLDLNLSWGISWVRLQKINQTIHNVEHLIKSPAPAFQKVSILEKEWDEGLFEIKINVYKDITLCISGSLTRSWFKCLKRQ